MGLTAFDRDVLRQVVAGVNDQQQLAKNLKAKPSKVARSLTRLHEVIELERDGQQRRPVLRIFDALATLEDQLRALREAAA